MFASLAPLARICIHRPLWSTLLAFDASLRARAVVYSKASPSEMESLIDAYIGQARQDVLDRNYEHKARGFFQCREWTMAFCHQRKRPYHINGLEAATAVLALEWAVYHDIIGHRALILSDSMVVIKSLRNGARRPQDSAFPAEERPLKT